MTFQMNLLLSAVSFQKYLLLDRIIICNNLSQSRDLKTVFNLHSYVSILKTTIPIEAELLKKYGIMLPFRKQRGGKKKSREDLLDTLKSCKSCFSVGIFFKVTSLGFGSLNGCQHLSLS